MKVLDYSSIPFAGGKLSFGDRIKGTLHFGFSWVAEMKSQEVIVGYLSRVLDNKFTLLRNITILDANVPVPLILIGPHGVTVMYNSAIKGIYRAKGETWDVMDNRTRRFEPVQPNLVMRTTLMSRAVRTFLSRIGFAVEPEGVLALTNISAHVDTLRPAVRVLLVDALERFGARLMQAQPIYKIEEVRAIVNAITTSFEAEDEVEKDVASTPVVSQPTESKLDKALDPIQKKMNFKRRQWLLLGSIVAAEVIILLIFLIVIMLTS
ncbi:MAG: hypothetical protein KKD28_00910 [Chloroflexi bacterium]|nr:hypothetical protein [Chloroflexota bacterium]MBU1660016.1 hypothetical protein [Chloroflexota bacterium]